jgi:hypothetical protein
MGAPYDGGQQLGVGWQVLHASLRQPDVITAIIAIVNSSSLVITTPGFTWPCSVGRLLSSSNSTTRLAMCKSNRRFFATIDDDFFHARVRIKSYTLW